MTSMSSSSSGSGTHYKSMSRTRPVVSPSWARNLPPDELEMLENDTYDHAADSAAATRPKPKKRGSSLARLVGGSSVAANKPASKELWALHGGQPSSSSGSGSVSASDTPAESCGDGSGAPRPAAPVHSTNDLRRGTLGADRWWTFTMPNNKYLDRVHDYVRNQDTFGGHGNEKGKEREREQQDNDDGNEGEAAETGDDAVTVTGRNGDGESRSMRDKDDAARKRKGRTQSVDVEKQDYHRSMTLNLHHLAPPNVFSLNQTETPGWSSPWSPFHRDSDARENADPFTIAQANAEAQSKTTRFETFILRNPFTPLLFRSFNLALAVTALGLAAHVRAQQRSAGVLGVLGSSTLMVICVSPMAILHIFITLYIEYFGLPIGLWRISTKLTHTFTELIFICLFSSILSLSMDDLFTSALECTAYTPYARYNDPPPVVGNSSVDGTLAKSMCNQQIAIVVVVFLSVILYAAILIVSLFRIFAKVTRKS